MKKFKKRFLISTLFLLFFVFTVTPASAYLLNWGFDPSGTGNSILSVPEYFDLTGTATISNDYNTFTFQEDGTFTSFSYGPPATGFGPLHATFTATGSLGALAFTFDSVPSSLKIYDASSILIGTFDLLSGGGGLNNDFGPSNGQITANFVAQSLATGYWFTDASGSTDLSTLPAPILTLGFATTNATIVTGSENFDSSGRLTNFEVGNNGQFRLAVTPEPGTLLLFGVGLLGFAAVARKKFFKA